MREQGDLKRRYVDTAQISRDLKTLASWRFHFRDPPAIAGVVVDAKLTLWPL